MTRKDFETLPAKERLHFYRCPACGEMVDRKDVEQITVHHAHILHPERFRFAPPQLESSGTRSRS